MKKAVQRVVLFCCALAAVASAGTAWAAPTSQTVTLLPGWNAVFLEVDPADPAPGTALAGVTGVESVWAWNHRSSSVEYVTDPGLPLDPPAYMLAYVPGNPLVTSLHAIRGETAYLVKIADGSPATQDWVVNGEPAVPRASWKPNSFNLVGFHLDRSLAPASLPTYFDFFAGSPAHAAAGPEIYRLDNAAGTWVPVVDTDRMAPGEAFWIKCEGSSTFGGPLSVQLEQSAGLDFGAALDQLVLVIRNGHTAQRTATVRALTDGGVLHYGEWAETPPDSGSWLHTWLDLFASNPSIDIAAGGEARLRIGAVRAGLTADFSDNVEVRDGLGVSILLPARVVATGTAGLWVGNVVVDKVTDNASGAGVPTPVGSPFSFRVIVHVSDDATPQVSLLREVVQLWDEGTWKPDPDNQGHLVVDQPGQFVLVANPARLGEFRGAALRDGQEVGRRISTAAFGFEGANPSASGAFAPGSTLVFDLTLPPDDPTNPFLHRTHKDHAAAQSYEVTRQLRFEFLLDDPASAAVGGVPFLGWGSSEVGGVFTETIGLLQADPADVSSYDVDVEGTFRLRRVSDVRQLQL